MPCRVILVVPCFNEAERLPIQAIEAFQPDSFELELLFVDDGSTDGTHEVVQSLRDRGRCNCRIQLMRLPQNCGKAEAVRRGMLEGLTTRQGADLVGFWDADLATPLEELPRFVEILQGQPKVLAVFGARVKLLGRQIARRGYRHYYGRGFATVVSSLLDLPIYDSQCGAKLFRACNEVRVAFAEPFLSRWIFDVELLARLIQQLEEAPDRGPGQEIEDRLYELNLQTWTHIEGSKITSRDAVVAIEELARIGWRYRSALSARRKRRRSVR